jgi:hypothetical protein
VDLPVIDAKLPVIRARFTSGGEHALARGPVLWPDIVLGHFAERSPSVIATFRERARAFKRGRSVAAQRVANRRLVTGSGFVRWAPIESASECGLCRFFASEVAGWDWH